MTQTYSFDQIARLPLPGDNVAVVTQRLSAGTQIDYNGERFTLSHTLMEGHRFAAQPIAAGAPLLSWELPFGYALRDIAPGEYVCNQSMIDALGLRHLDFELPAKGNFRARKVSSPLNRSLAMRRIVLFLATNAAMDVAWAHVTTSC